MEAAMIFKQGDMVQVLVPEDMRDILRMASDAEDNHTKKFVGRIGRIVEVSTGGAGAIGQTPEDPLYTVAVPVLGQDGFFGNELKLVTRAKR